jgi:hypothetical protein
MFWFVDFYCFVVVFEWVWMLWLSFGGGWLEDSSG